MRRKVTSIFENTIYQNIVIEGNEKLLNAFCGENRIFQKELERQFDKKIICVSNENMAFGIFDISWK